MRPLLFALMFAFLVRPGTAQVHNPDYQYVSSDPAGSCSNGQPNQYNWVNNKTWGCNNGTWTVSASGSGASPAGTTGKLNATGNPTSGFEASTVTGATAATFGDATTGFSQTAHITPVGSGCCIQGIYQAANNLLAVAADKFYIYDESKLATPRLVSTITPHSGGDSIWSPFIFGKFAYFVEKTNNVWETWDISNLASPVYVSSTPCTGYTALVVDSKVYFLLTNGHFEVWDITNRAVPQMLGTTSLAQGNNGSANSLIAYGPYVIAGTGDATGGGPMFYVVNVSNPAAPAQVSVINNPAGGNFVNNGLALRGQYLYVSGYTNLTTCTSNCTLKVYDLKDVTAPASVGGYTFAASAGTEASPPLIAGNYLYLGVADYNDCPGSLGCFLKVLDISDPASPTVASSFSTVAGGCTTDCAYIAQLALLGKSVVGASLNNLNFDTNDLYIWEAAGLNLAGANIGQLHSSEINVDGDAKFGGGLYAGTHIKIGSQGIGSQGPIGAAPGGNDFRCQNYVLSNNGTNFTVNGVAGIALPAATAASPVLFALPARGRIVATSIKTTTAWSGTGFTTFTATIGDSVGGTTFYDPTAYNLVTAVSNTNFQWVGGMLKSATYAGSNVIARITADANLNSNTITGVTDFEVCWAGLP